MSELFERFFCGVDLAEPILPPDQMKWVEEQILYGSGHTGGGRVAISHQMDAQINATRAVKGLVDANLMPRTIMDRCVLSGNDHPLQYETFITIHTGQRDIPEED